MAPQPTVGLVGSRIVDQGLQTTDKSTRGITEFAFPNDSRTPVQISIPREGAVGYSGPKLGDSYATNVEDSHLLYITGVLFASLIGTYMLQYV